MPFKSKKQIAKLSELERQGKVKAGTVKKWAAETPNINRLPERAPARASNSSTIQETKVIGGKRK